jgi:uncharacterized coiled-coil protein SlyX
MTRDELEARHYELEAERVAIQEKLAPLNEALTANKQAEKEINDQIAQIICPLKVGDVVTLSHGWKSEMGDWQIVSIYGERFDYGDARATYSWRAVASQRKKDGTLAKRSQSISLYTLKQRGTLINGQRFTS